MMKKLLSLLLALTLVLGMVCVTPVAAHADDYEGVPSATVILSLSRDDAYMVGEATGAVMAFKEITVPYFDLALYGLEEYYFVSEDYGSGGSTGPGSDLVPGTPEYAYGKVTLLHLYIYALEVYYCGVPEEDAGMGYLYDEDLIGTEVLYINGNVGSSFLVQFWGGDCNLNYYVNYEYPLASEGWGATSDQILLRDGDVISLGHFSGWSFYGDPYSIFNYMTVGNESYSGQYEYTVTQGDQVELSLWYAGANLGMTDGTAQNSVFTMPDVFYIPMDEVVADVCEWEYAGCADENGQLVLDTSDMAPGKYIVAIPGQYGEYFPDEICSTPGGLILNVESAFVDVESVSLNKSETTITIGGTETLTATVAPDNATDKTVTWTSSDESVATVANGVVTAVGVGEAVITATAGEKSATCTVTVAPIPVSSVTLNKGETTIAIGGTETLTATVAPDNATDKTVTWTSSDETVATVDNGVVTAVAVGTATITATAGEQSATCTVTVNDPQVDEVVALIDAIGKVTLDSKDAIEAARAAYDALSEEQKALVGEELLKVLTDAESIYRDLVPAIDLDDLVSTADKTLFTDVPAGHWAYEAVQYVGSNGIMKGVGADMFAPAKQLTRAELWTMLARMDGVNAEGGANWYANAKTWAESLELTDGTNALADVSREQIAVMLYRYAQYKGYTLITGITLDGYTDADQVSDWAVEAMTWANAAGIINGNGSAQLNPGAAATRMEVAAMIMRFMEKF